MPLSQDDYRARRCCPMCEAETPMESLLFPACDTVHKAFTCLACGQVWEQVYVYSHYVLKGKI